MKKKSIQIKQIEKEMRHEFEKQLSAQFHAIPGTQYLIILDPSTAPFGLRSG